MLSYIDRLSRHPGDGIRLWMTAGGRFDVDVLICGAGVIGLAIARAFARARREVLIVEAAESFGTQTSSRNSEVIHAGIYYPPGSHKARLCVEGKQRLYAFCKDYGVPHKMCGKLIVATSAAQVEKLRAIEATAQRCSVSDLREVSKADAKQLEPEVECHGALLSPSTGIIDSHQLMLSLLGDAEDHGASIAYNTTIDRVKMEPDGHVVVEAGGETLSPRLFVNASGLHAVTIARSFVGRPWPDPPIRPPRYCKGNYFKLQGRRPPFRMLVYPIPEAAGLGIHATVDLAGQTRFGPDVEWVDSPHDVNVDPARAERFYASIRKYWPALEEGQLVPDYAGIRPKLQAPDDTQPKDFRFDAGPFTTPYSHAPGFINLLGFESPGLTACLAIADVVVKMGAVKGPGD